MRGCLKEFGGFTMIELVTIMVLLGILAAVAIPRMTGSATMRGVQFRDQTVAALRFAQKTATSHRRLVCATFGASSVTLEIANSRPASACTSSLTIPGSNSNVIVGTDAATAYFAATPDALYFQPDGRATSDAPGLNATTLSTTIDGVSVYVAGATGYIGNAP